MKGAVATATEEQHTALFDIIKNAVEDGLAARNIKNDLPTVITAEIQAAAPRQEPGRDEKDEQDKMVDMLGCKVELDPKRAHNVLQNSAELIKDVEKRVSHLHFHNRMYFMVLTIIQLVMNLMVAVCGSMAEGGLLTQEAAGIFSTILGGAGALILSVCTMGEFQLKSRKYLDALQAVQKISCTTKGRDTVYACAGAVAKHDAKSLLQAVQQTAKELHQTIEACGYPISLTGVGVEVEDKNHSVFQCLFGTSNGAVTADKFLRRMDINSEGSISFESTRFAQLEVDKLMRSVDVDKGDFVTFKGERIIKLSTLDPTTQSVIKDWRTAWLAGQEVGLPVKKDGHVDAVLPVEKDSRA